MSATIAPHDIQRLLHAEHNDPFGVLGLQQIDQVWVVRSFRPDAKELAIVDRHQVKRRFPATRIAEEGLFEARLEGVTEAFDYLLQVTTWSGETFQISDPYSYGPILLTFIVWATTMRSMKSSERTFRKSMDMRV
jgi:1,4-alpha-glucan branching enzyme